MEVYLLKWLTYEGQHSQSGICESSCVLTTEIGTTMLSDCSI